MAIDFQRLENSYFGMRHGQSEANVAGRVVSAPNAGIAGFGITTLGRQQVTARTRVFMKCNPWASTIRVFSSDFLRARQTAELFAEIASCNAPVLLVPDLRERFFGRYEGLSDSSYHEVWRLDAMDQHHQQQGVESVVSVRERVRRLVANLEKTYRGQQFVLVAHGDVLQISQTLFQDLPGQRHRQLPHLEVAEIRRLNHK